LLLELLLLLLVQDLLMLLPLSSRCVDIASLCRRIRRAIHPFLLPLAPTQHSTHTTARCG